MTYKYEKKLNWAFAYLIFITIVALIFVIAFAFENHCKNEMISSYEREMQTQENTYQDMQERYSEVNNQLKIITDEYNDLLEQSK